MLAKVIIKRRFRQRYTHEVIALLHDLRAAAMSQPGYISGETLTQPDDPQKLVVIGTWQNLESWHKWKKSDRRKELDAMLDILLDEPAIYEEYIVGAAGH
jgi:heme-degrading monooxygenase HmoA